jgi:hypothetical protein
VLIGSASSRTARAIRGDWGSRSRCNSSVVGLGHCGSSRLCSYKLPGPGGAATGSLFWGGDQTVLPQLRHCYLFPPNSIGEQPMREDLDPRSPAQSSRGARPSWLSCVQNAPHISTCRQAGHNCSTRQENSPENNVNTAGIGSEPAPETWCDPRTPGSGGVPIAPLSWEACMPGWARSCPPACRRHWGTSSPSSPSSSASEPDSNMTSSQPASSLTSSTVVSIADCDNTDTVPNGRPAAKESQFRCLDCLVGIVF